MSLIIYGQWFEPYPIIEPFQGMSYDALAEIMMSLEPYGIVAFSQTCRTMHILFKVCIDMVLCQLAETGQVALLPIMEHKTWIDRIRSYVPEFELIPVGLSSCKSR